MKFVQKEVCINIIWKYHLEEQDRAVWNVGHFQQTPVQYVLFYLGRSGWCATNRMIRNMFGTGKGTTMIVNNDRHKIQYYPAGYPGSAHNNHVYHHTEQVLFLILSDSALSNSLTVVASFKYTRDHILIKEQEAFNTLLGKPQVVVYYQRMLLDC